MELLIITGKLPHIKFRGVINTMSNDMNLIMENFRKIKNSAKKLNMGQLSRTLRLHENPMGVPVDTEAPEIPLDQPPAGANEQLIAKGIRTALEQHLADQGQQFNEDAVMKKAYDFLKMADGDGPGRAFMEEIPDHGLGNVTAQEITDAMRNHVAPVDQIIARGLDDDPDGP